MRIAHAIFLAGAFALCPASSFGQGRATIPAAHSWIGRSVALARVGNRSIAAACPRLAQIDHFVRERSLKWDDASIGCRFMLAGNFTKARVVEESGGYLRVTFTLTSFPAEHTFWTPRRDFRLVS